VLAILEAAGWPSWFLLVCSVLALAIILERTWSLRKSRVMPKGLLESVLRDYRSHGIDREALKQLGEQSALGFILAAGLLNATSARDIMKESIEDAGRRVVGDLDRHLTALGTIASISPLLGLFGTVVGMIVIFKTQGPTGTNPAELAHGISIALYNTAFGLIVAVPSMVFFRHFRAHIDGMVLEMEQEAIKLVEVVHGERKLS
jgi:biopolymer transport protein ExbB